MSPSLHITGDADGRRAAVVRSAGLLIGMLLDQQVTMETAFAGPARSVTASVRSMRRRSPGTTRSVRRAIPDHAGRAPFPRLDGRAGAVVAQIVDDWDGDAAALWTRDSPDGAEVLRRLKTLPGFGEQKARIFLALLGKQYGYDGGGWREAAGEYGDEGSARSVADITDAESLLRVRAAKQAVKAAAKK